ncbi:MAG: NAD-binding protein [Caldilineaceae bacterium]|nr:NAD-binding protein [Caldilineaceae bacterium]
MIVLIAGGGKVGSHLAQLLHKAGHQVTVIEKRPDHVTELHERMPGIKVMAGSCTDPDLLERSGVRQAHVVAAVTGSDETNLVVTSLARFEFQAPRTIARVNNPRNAWLYTDEMGVDVALDQADLMARLIQEQMSLGDMMTLLKLRRGEYALVEEKVDEHATAAGKMISELDLPRDCILAAILRGGSLVIPRGDTIILPGDEVLAVVHENAVSQLAAALETGSATAVPPTS